MTKNLNQNQLEEIIQLLKPLGLKGSKKINETNLYIQNNIGCKNDAREIINAKLDFIFYNNGLKLLINHISYIEEEDKYLINIRSK